MWYTRIMDKSSSIQKISLTETEWAFVVPRLKQMAKLAQEMEWMKKLVTERVGVDPNEFVLNPEEKSWVRKEEKKELS